uniref:Uncharacterized protein n=1 Tax=Opuntia streptacantha TaxID=393608 RepID=A0A7C9EAZ4_OPUST
MLFWFFTSGGRRSRYRSLTLELERLLLDPRLETIIFMFMCMDSVASIHDSSRCSVERQWLLKTELKPRTPALVWPQVPHSLPFRHTDAKKLISPELVACLEHLISCGS